MTDITVASIADLDAAIATANALGSGAVTIELANDIAMDGTALTAIELATGVSLTILGDGHTLDAGGTEQGLFVYSGTLAVDDLTIADAVAQGGNASGVSGSYYYGGGGGGGAGLGGGLFVGSVASVTLMDAAFQDDGARGGNGTPGYSGSGAGADTGEPALGTLGAGGTAAAYSAGGGGAGGGVTGGFGGGSASGQIFEGIFAVPGAGGGGAAAGGDIFVQQGGQLTILGGSLGVGTVAAGSGAQQVFGVASEDGAASRPGTGFADGLFIGAGDIIALAAQTGETLTIAGAIADASALGGAAGSVIIGDAAGDAGTVLFTANAGYAGGTNIESGTLQLGLGGTSGWLEGNVSVATGTVLVLDNTGTNTLAGAIKGDGTLVQETGNATLRGNDSLGGGILLEGGTLTLGNGGTLAGDVTLAGGNLAFGQNGAATFGGTLSGSGTVLQAGSGATSLTSANNFTGTLALEAGTLALENSAAAGAATIAFGTAPNLVLRIGAADAPANDITGFAPRETIDLQGFTATGATLLAGNELLVESRAGNVTLALDPAQNYAGIGFITLSDGAGGTDITPVVTSYSVSTEAELNNALTLIAETSGALPAGTTISLNIAAGTTIDLTSALEAVYVAKGVSLVINGDNATLDGEGVERGLFIYSGNVSISDLTIADTRAMGGNGGMKYSAPGGFPVYLPVIVPGLPTSGGVSILSVSNGGGGGGGAGLGGGLFVAGTSNGGAAPANVTLDNVSFLDNSATGGDGAFIIGPGVPSGGGGLGGNGGVGGGGIGSATKGAGGSYPAGGAGTAGIVPGLPGNTGAGGGAAALYSGRMLGQGGGAGASGKSGGFGGGGGGGGTITGIGTRGAVTIGTGGNGGFGGGGGAGKLGGNGGFGGGGGYGFGNGGRGGQGGFGAGNGGAKGGSEAGGGGGLGAGGDIFVQQGASLTVIGGTLGAGTATGGLAAGGWYGADGPGNGEGLGGAIFLQGNQTISLAAPDGQTLTVSADIADQSGSSGTGSEAGAGGIIINDTQGDDGTVIFTATESYVGATEIESGTLQLGTSGTAGGIFGDASIAAGAALIFDRSGFYAYAGTLSGGGRLAVEGGLSLTLAADSSLGGGVSLDASTLVLATGSSLGGNITLANGSALIAEEAGPLALDSVITGNGAVTQAGDGALTLDGANDFFGGVTLLAGTLALESTQAAGTGTIQFGTATGLLLQIGAGDVPANAIAGFQPGATIDLQGFTGTGATLTGNVLEISAATGPATDLTLAGSLATAPFVVADDGTGGTDIFQLGTSYSAATEAQLNNILQLFDRYGSQFASGTQLTIALTNDISLGTALANISLASGIGLLVDGADYTLDGAGNQAGPDIEAGNVTFANLTITDMAGDALSLAASVTLALDNAALTGSLAGTGTVLVEDTVTLANGGDIEDTITLSAGATLNISGGATLGGALSGSGVLQAANEALTLSGTNDFSGSVTLQNGTLALENNNALGSALLSLGANATLQIAQGGVPGNLIAGLAGGDVIDLRGETITAAALAGNLLGLTTASGGVFALSLASTAALSGQFQITSDGNGGSNIAPLQTDFTVDNEAELNAVLASLALDGGLYAPGTQFTIELGGASIALTSALNAINLVPGETLLIDGAGGTLDGQSDERGLFVYSGTVTVENLVLADMNAVGGAGGYAGGGGGAGLGGALFVAGGSNGGAAPADVTLVNVGFLNDATQGGAGSKSSSQARRGAYGGGGGLGGNGSSYFSAYTAGGGGGVGNPATNGGTAGQGIIPNIGRAYGSAGVGGGTGSSGGGGGVGGSTGISDNYGDAGGAGGFGGGGGGGSYYSSYTTNVAGGAGGFGGGGGGGAQTGGAGGFGGGGGGYQLAGGKGVGAGGFGAGAGGFSTRGSVYGAGNGGGGLGAGGDIFVQQGGSLTIIGGDLAAGTVIGGTAYGYAHPGNAYGNGMFLQGNESIALGAALGQTLTISGVIADQSGSGGTGTNAGAGTLALTGPGTVLLAASNSFTGGIELEGGTLVLGAASAAGSGEIIFSNDPSLAFTQEDAPRNVIDGFGAGDIIDITDLAFSGTALTLTPNADGVLSLPGSSISLTFANAPAELFLVSDGSGGSDIITCFYPGTHIATPAGDVAVEALREGQMVLTAEGAALPIRWVGRSDISTRFAPPLRALPIRIRAGALGSGLPLRDLLVSSDHALFLDGILVQAGALVNGADILREYNVAERFSYYHVELDCHALLLAEGAAAESFVDNVERMHFANWDARTTPTQPIVELPYPRAKSWRQMPARLRARLAARQSNQFAGNVNCPTASTRGANDVCFRAVTAKPRRPG